MQTRTYLLLLITLCALGFASVGVVNYVVDPYRFFDSPDIPGVNEYRQKFFFGQVVSKPYLLRKKAPEAVILGVSRAGSSLSTDHPGWAGIPVYNNAIAGSSAYTLWRSYQHARASGDLRQVVLTLDFFMFNIYREQEPTSAYTRAYDERLAVRPDFSVNRGFPVRWLKDTINSLVSFEMLYESWNTVLAQGRIADRTLYRATLFASGFWINDPMPNRTQRRGFRIIENQYMTITWFPRPEKKFAMLREDGTSNLVYLRRILADAHQQGIDVRLAFMPFHARLAEAMRAVDIWDDFEQWKVDVVNLVEQEAANAGSAPYPVWDFSGYNSITTEPVPANDDPDTRMRWHLDASHVTRAAGDLMQTQILETPGERRTDFGRRLNSSNIAEYMARSRTERARYVEGHPRDLREIGRSAERTSDWRQPR